MIAGLKEHPLLSAEAQSLLAKEEVAFEQQAELAQLLLGFPDTLPSGAATLAKLSLAVALQVNFQIKYGAEPSVIISSASSHTRNSIAYRDKYVDPRALQVANSALGSEAMAARYDSITSIRFPRHV